MPLTETQIRNLKPASTPKKHFDGEGLFLYVTPAGSKCRGSGKMRMAECLDSA